MSHISYYSKEAINSRLHASVRVYTYNRSTEYGVTRIYYKADITEATAAIAGFLIIPGIIKLASPDIDTQEGTYYFDASNGNKISYYDAQERKSKNRQADSLDKQGNELHRRQKYEEAYDKFKQAYEICSSGYSEEARFKSNRDIAKNNWADELNRQGDERWNNEDFQAAFNKFEAAFQKCSENYKNRQLYQKNMTKAKNELDAITLNSQGIALLALGKYDEAFDKFNIAYDKSQVASHYNLYKTNRDSTNENKIINDKADAFEREAINFHQQGKFKEAYFKYGMAYNTCKRGYSKEAQFKSNRDIAKRNWADQLNGQGNKLWNDGDFEAAFDKFQSAFLNSSDSYQNKQLYQQNMTKAKKELDAVTLNSEGNALLQQGKFWDAYKKFNEAHEMSQVPRLSNEYKANRDAANAEKMRNDKAEVFGREAFQFYREGKFEEAYNKYDEALSNCTSRNSKIQIFKSNMDAVTNHWADQLHEQGKAFLNKENFADAMKKFQSAIQKSTPGYKNISIFQKSKNIAEKEVNAAELNAEGDDLFKQGKFKEASEKYSEAYKKSKNHNRIELYKKNNQKALENKTKNDQANVFNDEGIELQRLTKYEEAYKKFDDAFLKCVDGYIKKTLFESNRETAKDKWADQLNQEGEELLNRGNFSGALQKFEMALQKASNGYKSKSLFRGNKDKAGKEAFAFDVNVQGDELFKQGKFAEAYEKYNEAIGKSQVKSQIELYEKNKQQALVNKTKNDEADILNEKGIELQTHEKYEEAYKKFDEAFLKCVDGYVRKTIFESNRETAKDKWADQLNREGEELFNRRDFSGALQKFEIALQKASNEYKNKSLFRENKDKAEKEAIAFDVNALGDELFEQGKFAEAYEKYNEAIGKSQVKSQIELYEKNKQLALVNKTRNDEADILNDEGIELQTHEKYEEAYKKFDEAFLKCVDGYLRKTIFESNRETAKDKWADQLNREGEELFNRGDFSGALQKFETALQKAFNEYKNKSLFRENKDKAEKEAIASDVNAQGDELFKQGKLAEAYEKYHEAIGKSQVKSQIELYEKNKQQALVNKTKNDEADILNDEGIELQTHEKYEEAYKKFDEAFLKCVDGYLRKTIFESNRETAKDKWADQLNREGEELFNRGDFSGALQKFETALQKAFNEYKNKSLFRENKDKAEKEATAFGVNAQGDELFKQGKFAEAYGKYHEAIGKSQVKSQIELYEKNKQQALVNKTRNDEADILNDEGIELQTHEKYEEAYKKFDEAFVKCVDGYIKKTLFESNRETTKDIGLIS